MARDVPMHRLLQGEVGSGKTIVALRAMLAAVDSGGQAALLAPTEVLAAQHHRTITAMLGDLAEGGMLGGAEHGTRVALLTGSQSTAERRRTLLDVVTGDAGIVVGTHALLQENVDFFDLGLVVVDEQHRFGVEQRDALRGKGAVPPHVLVMTATPIPRTVAMTVFGDLETSTLRELPAGRAPITTHVVPEDQPELDGAHLGPRGRGGARRAAGLRRVPAHRRRRRARRRDRPARRGGGRRRRRRRRARRARRARSRACTPCTPTLAEEPALAGLSRRGAARAADRATRRMP